jgi:hypothetical protein
MRELTIPVEIENLDEAREFLRFWIADGHDYVRLHVGAMGKDEVHQWGMILADISVHITRALQQDGVARSEKELRAEIESAYRKRLTIRDVDYSGVIGGTRQ